MSGNSRKVGFVSLGCPKALVDSERILTQLRMDDVSLLPPLRSPLSAPADQVRDTLAAARARDTGSGANIGESVPAD